MGGIEEVGAEAALILHGILQNFRSEPGVKLLRLMSSTLRSLPQEDTRDCASEVKVEYCTFPIQRVEHPWTCHK